MKDPISSAYPPDLFTTTVKIDSHNNSQPALNNCHSLNPLPNPFLALVDTSPLFSTATSPPSTIKPSTTLPNQLHPTAPPPDLVDSPRRSPQILQSANADRKDGQDLCRRCI
jgi:hypothetical protein